jgi:hypothetical protein
MSKVRRRPIKPTIYIRSLLSVMEEAEYVDVDEWLQHELRRISRKIRSRKRESS